MKHTSSKFFQLTAHHFRFTGSKSEEEKTPKYAPYHFPDDIGSNNSGYYELLAVLTHQGRSSNTGHYVAWVRKKGGE